MKLELQRVDWYEVFYNSSSTECWKKFKEIVNNLVSEFVALQKQTPPQKPVFFLSEFSFTDTDNSQDSRGREGTIFYSTLPLPPAHEHSDIYLQLCTWDDYHIFLIATLVFTRLLLDEIYHLIELLFDWLMTWCWFSFVCLFVDLILGFATAIWHEKPVNSNSHRLSSLCYKRTD